MTLIGSHLVKVQHCICTKWRVITTIREQHQWILPWVKTNLLNNTPTFTHQLTSTCNKIITTLSIFPVNFFKDSHDSVQYYWWVPTVQLCGMIGGYWLYSCAVWLVGTDCTDVWYDLWVPTVQLSICSSEVCFRPEDGSSVFLRNTATYTLAYSKFS